MTANVCNVLSDNFSTCDTPKRNVLPVSVITTCYGRNTHLYNLLASLQSGTTRPAEVIIVNDDADKQQLRRYTLNIVQVATTESDKAMRADDGSHCEDETSQVGFDIGRNRNKGAQYANYDTLIFLDVDCIASANFIQGLFLKSENYPDALIMGQPRYLTRPLTEQESLILHSYQLDNEGDHEQCNWDNWLHPLSVLNPYRDNMVSDTASPSSGDSSQDSSKYAQEVKKTEDYGAFWSLCFAIKQSQFKRIGGFDTDYVGYGAEDTDFAFSARQLDIALYLTSDVVYHQQHAVYRPPLNHLDSIVINANRFYTKWQHWAMGGWLKEFAEMGFIDWHSEQDKPIIIKRYPTESERDAAHSPHAPFA